MNQSSPKTFKEIWGQMCREIQSHRVYYRHERSRAEVLKNRATGKVHHQQLEVFRRTHGDERADLACIGFTNVFSVERIRSITVQDFLQASRPSAEHLAREDVALICLTYVHDPKAVSRVLLDRMNPLTFSMVLYAVLQKCKRQNRLRFRVWNDITNSSAKRGNESQSWVGGGIIPYLLFDHISVGYEPNAGFADRLWPRIECKLASYVHGTTFVIRDENDVNADENGIVIKNRGLSTNTSRTNYIQEALRGVANWALSGPIFSLPTFWDSDRQALACMFGRILKSNLFTDMIAAATEEPKIDPMNLIIRTADEYEAVRKNCCYEISQEMAESRTAENDVVKKFRKDAIIDGPRYTFTGPVWRADVTFIPSCFEYAPLNAETATVNEKRARKYTRAHIFTTQRGRTYALLKNDNSFWKGRAAVWLELEYPCDGYKRASVTRYTRILTDTNSHEQAIIFGLAAERLIPKASLRGKDLNWIGPF